MTFDPFGDFEAEGYLRNYAKEKDLAIMQARYEQQKLKRQGQ